MNKIKKTDIEHRSGFMPNLMGLVEPMREGYYKLEKVAVTGNAPKDFVRIYEYGEARKANSSSWPAYIAKVGHKWYPNESITEQLMTRIGQTIGVKVADSKLMLVKGQLRFMSKFFLDAQRERLVHGSEIFSAHFEDEEFVKRIDEANQTRDVFTFQAIKDAIFDVYPENADEIMKKFVAMLFFDAIVGNNDRHFENWGVIENIKNKSEVRFSPVYDTARGLFWNFPESNLDSYLDHESKLDSYINGSLPTTGWDDRTNLNHFDLLQMVLNQYPNYCNFIARFDFKAALLKIKYVVNNDFQEFFSSKRRCLIVRCLEKRITIIQQMVN